MEFAIVFGKRNFSAYSNIQVSLQTRGETLTIPSQSISSRFIKLCARYYIAMNKGAYDVLGNTDTESDCNSRFCYTSFINLCFVQLALSYDGVVGR